MPKNENHKRDLHGWRVQKTPNCEGNKKLARLCNGVGEMMEKNLKTCKERISKPKEPSIEKINLREVRNKNARRK